MPIILTTLFPSTQGYIVTPQHRLPDDPESHIPDLIIEVVKLVYDAGGSPHLSLLYRESK
jgi:hypothetical protein